MYTEPNKYFQQPSFQQPLQQLLGSQSPYTPPQEELIHPTSQVPTHQIQGQAVRGGAQSLYHVAPLGAVSTGAYPDSCNAHSAREAPLIPTQPIVYQTKNNMNVHGTMPSFQSTNHINHNLSLGQRSIGYQPTGSSVNGFQPRMSDSARNNEYFTESTAYAPSGGRQTSGQGYNQCATLLSESTPYFSSRVEPAREQYQKSHGQSASYITSQKPLQYQDTPATHSYSRQSTHATSNSNRYNNSYQAQPSMSRQGSNQYQPSYTANSASFQKEQSEQYNHNSYSAAPPEQKFYGPKPTYSAPQVTNFSIPAPLYATQSYSTPAQTHSAPMQTYTTPQTTNGNLDSSRSYQNQPRFTQAFQQQRLSPKFNSHERNTSSNNAPQQSYASGNNTTSAYNTSGIYSSHPGSRTSNGGYTNKNIYTPSNTQNFSLGGGPPRNNTNYMNLYSSQPNNSRKSSNSPYARPSMSLLRTDIKTPTLSIKQLDEYIEPPTIILRQRKPKKTRDETESETESDKLRDLIPAHRSMRSKPTIPLLNTGSNVLDYKRRKRSDEIVSATTKKPCGLPAVKETEEERMVRLIQAIKMKPDSKVLYWDRKRMAARDIDFLGMDGDAYRLYERYGEESVKIELDVKVDVKFEESTALDVICVRDSLLNVPQIFTVEETAQFMNGLVHYGRDFYCISKGIFKGSRSTQDLVEQYYLHKYNYEKCYKGNRHAKYNRRRRRESMCMKPL